MTWLRSILERLRALAVKGSMDLEMDEELRFHLDMETAKNLRAGMSPAEGRRQAMIAFGGFERFKEQTRDQRGTKPLEDLQRDLQFAVRTLRKVPGLVAITVLSLGLGIGASSTVFSLAKGLVWGDPGPLGDPERIVAVYAEEDDGGLYGEISFPDYTELQTASRAIGNLAAHRMGVLTVGNPEARDRILVELVTGNYFQVLGVQPALGRLFLPRECVPGAAERLVVLSYRAWKERFGKDPGALGQVMELDGESYTIIGVAPQGLFARYLNFDLDAWVPLGVPGGIYRVSPRALSDRMSRQFFMLGRLSPGRGLEEAQAEMSVLASRLQAEHPESWVGPRDEARSLTVVSEAESRVPPGGRAALAGLAGLFLGGALLILLLACTNVASLLLARVHGRSWEMAVRVSLGAGRGRLFRMLLAESLLLSLAGGALGLVLAHLATGYLRAIPIPMDVPLRLQADLDRWGLLFALVLALGASLVAGVGPALRGSRPNLTPALRRQRGWSMGRGRRISVRSLLVVGQVAAATIFVIGSGLAVRTVQASASFDMGLNAEGVAVAWEEPPDGDLTGSDLRTHFLELAGRIESHPEVRSVALARIAEAYVFMDDFATADVQIDGAESLRIPFNAVTPGYLEMLQVPLERGRTILPGDVEGSPRVAVVNQAFLDRILPGRDGIGERFQVDAWYDADRRQETEGATLEIVGVVKSPERPEEGRGGPFFWVSYLQDTPVRAIVHVKGPGNVAGLIPILRQEGSSGSDDFTPLEPGAYADYIDYRFIGHRIMSAVFGFAGLFSLVLAVIGVFGIVSFAVSRRLKEMAIRRALGAREKTVLVAVLRDGLRGSAVGIVLGLAIALPLAYLARSVLLGVPPLDPLAVGGGTLLLGAVALLAGIIPARRLLKAQPMDVLREE